MNHHSPIPTHSNRNSEKSTHGNNFTIRKIEIVVVYQAVYLPRYKNAIRPLSDAASGVDDIDCADAMLGKVVRTYVRIFLMHGDNGLRNSSV